MNADEDVRRPAWLLGELIDAARSPSRFHEQKRERLLVETAKFVVTVAPERVEQFARSNGRDSLVVTMAARLAVTDPARSERLLSGIGKLWDRWTLVAMAELAVAVAPSDPRRARKLLTEAESRARQSASDETLEALPEMATVVAPSDPRRAAGLIKSAVAAAKEKKHRGVAHAALAAMKFDLRLAERIAATLGPRQRLHVLGDLARTAASTDPDHAVEIARSFEDPAELSPLLADIAAKMATRTGQLADSLIAEADAQAARIMDGSKYETAMTSLIRAIATRDPGQAVDRAKAIAKDTGSPWPMTVAAGAVAAAQPERAERIAMSIEDDLHRNAALAAAAEAMAVVDPERAERLCQSISDTYFAYQEALARTAIAMARADLDRAEELALSVTHPHHRADALLEVLKVLTG
ncbi:hypothetical protein [Amycolatopsis sp. NPDC051071]|uniref:hypothetical protein n=1 Tax=Amycolatopsis sp. NPDC051071 TaxID=3154637 RepID=UPI00343555F8